MAPEIQILSSQTYMMSHAAHSPTYLAVPPTAGAPCRIWACDIARCVHQAQPHQQPCIPFLFSTSLPIDLDIRLGDLPDPACHQSLHSTQPPGPPLAWSSRPLLHHKRRDPQTQMTLTSLCIKQVLALEMSKLQANVWFDEPTSAPACRPSKHPIKHIYIWLECYMWIAMLLVMRFLEKDSELWAYQFTILMAASN